MLAGGWLVILCATLLSAGAAELVQQVDTPKYNASTRLFVTVNGDSGVRSAYENGRGSVSRILSYDELTRSNLILRRAIQDGDLDVTPRDLAKQLSMTVTPVSALMDLNVRASNADYAVKAVNAVAATLVATTSEIENGDNGPVAQVQVVDAATSASPIRKSWKDNMLAGGGIGLAMSTLLVLAVGAARNRVLNAGQLGHLVEETMSNEASRKVG